MLPFSRAQFLELFAAYNSAVWPAQLIAYALGALALMALVGPTRMRGRIALASLAVMWLWTGSAYHIIFFAAVNPGAILFGLLFIVQAAVLAVLAARDGILFRLRGDAPSMAAAFLLVYSLIAYPLIALMTHSASEIPMFGITPCPVTLFTLGFLLLAEPRPPLWAWVAPVLWSLIGGSAGILLGVVQDWPLLVAGVTAMLFAYLPGRGGSSPNHRSAIRPQAS